MTFSFVVPVYNVEKYLPQCIESIINQTYRNLEIILVNDGSTDASGHICDAYSGLDDRIRVIHKENGGVSSARNAALDVMSGEYVSFVDADDYLAGDFINRHMIMIPYCVSIAGVVAFSESANEIVKISDSYFGDYLSYDLLFGLVQSSLFGYACGKVYHKNTISNLKFENIPYREDLIFNLSVFSRSKRFSILDSAPYYYRQHEDSILHKKYAGPVPEVFTTAEKLCFDFDYLSARENHLLTNIVLVVYLTDVISKCILMHQNMDERQKIFQLKRIFGNKKIRKKLSLIACNARWQLFFVFCYKLNLFKFYYIVMKRVV